MDIYQLDYVLHEPAESEGWLYLAEVPALRGCMAWGTTPEETLWELADVARMLIELHPQGKGGAVARGVDSTGQPPG